MRYQISYLAVADYQKIFTCIITMRLAVIFCLSAWHACGSGVEILIRARATDPVVPFDRRQFEGVGKINKCNESTPQPMLEKIKNFTPAAILVVGWADRGYLAICRMMRAQEVPVMSGCFSLRLTPMSNVPRF